MADMELDQSPSYNEVLHQISSSLNNARNTFGPQSTQYQTILEIFKDYLWRMDSESKRASPSSRSAVDPDMLSAAMGFLEVEGE